MVSSYSDETNAKLQTSFKEALTLFSKFLKDPEKVDLFDQTISQGFEETPAGVNIDVPAEFSLKKALASGALSRDFDLKASLHDDALHYATMRQNIDHETNKALFEVKMHHELVEQASPELLTEVILHELGHMALSRVKFNLKNKCIDQQIQEISKQQAAEGIFSLPGARQKAIGSRLTQDFEGILSRNEERAVEGMIGFAKPNYDPAACRLEANYIEHTIHLKRNIEVSPERYKPQFEQELQEHLDDKPAAIAMDLNAPAPQRTSSHPSTSDFIRNASMCRDAASQLGQRQHADRVYDTDTSYATQLDASRFSTQKTLTRKNGM